VGISSLTVVGFVLLAHLPVIALEGAITASLVHYLCRVKPEWLR
jgi:ABC-type Co2+ transport system permease subunit